MGIQWYHTVVRNYRYTVLQAAMVARRDARLYEYKTHPVSCQVTASPGTHLIEVEHLEQLEWTDPKRKDAPLSRVTLTAWTGFQPV